jgi:hypothetical protein
MTKIFAFLSVSYVILLIFVVNLLLKQQSTQLQAMKAVISHEIFNCVSLLLDTDEFFPVVTYESWPFQNSRPSHTPTRSPKST